MCKSHHKIQPGTGMFEAEPVLEWGHHVVCTLTGVFKPEIKATDSVRSPGSVGYSMKWPNKSEQGSWTLARNSLRTPWFSVEPSGSGSWFVDRGSQEKPYHGLGLTVLLPPETNQVSWNITEDFESFNFIIDNRPSALNKPRASPLANDIPVTYCYRKNEYTKETERRNECHIGQHGA